MILTTGKTSFIGARRCQWKLILRAIYCEEGKCKKYMILRCVIIEVFTSKFNQGDVSIFCTSSLQASLIYLIGLLLLFYHFFCPTFFF